MSSLLELDFLRNAVLAGLLVSILCGIVGTYVVVNRIVFLAGGIAHASYGGIGLAAFAGLPMLPSILGFSLLSSFLMAHVSWQNRGRADTVIGVLWAAGMALGMVLLDLTPGYSADLMGYLFGSILAVSTQGLWLAAIVVLLVLGFVLLFYRELLALSHDPNFAKIRGVPVRPLYFGLVTAVALSVVVATQAVGLILVIALMTIPAHIAERWCGSLKTMMVVSILLGILFAMGGLAISWFANLSSGPAIIGLACASYFLSLLLPDRRSARE